MKTRNTIIAITIASMFAVACSNLPAPVMPDGSDRKPINSAAQIEDYKARTAEETANFNERSALSRQVEGLQKQVEELKTYLVMLHMLAENGQLNLAQLLSKKPPQAPVAAAKAPAQEKGTPVYEYAAPAVASQATTAPTQAIPQATAQQAPVMAPEAPAPAATVKPHTSTQQAPAVAPQANVDGSESIEVRDNKTIVFRITHASGRSGFNPSKNIQALLLAAAREGKRIEIRGRTDAMNENEGDKKISMQRALNAREFLVSNGIDPSKIRARYLAVGDYVADNNTTEGKKRNRRVEIETLDVDIAALELKMSMTFGAHSS